MRIEAKKILFEGAVIPAIPLALDKNRKFDETAQRTLVRYYLHAGAGGIAVAVHSTQFEIRLPEVNLFFKTVKTVTDEINRFEKQTGKTVIKISGVCGPVEQAAAEARFAADIGCDAALLSPGGLSDFDEGYMLGRTKEIAGIIPVIGFYLQPAAGGRIFSAEYWKKLANIEGVTAIKCAPFDRYKTLELVRGAALSERRSEIALYTGNDDNIITDLLTSYEINAEGKKIKMRFAGGLLGQFAVWTKTAADLFEKVKKHRENGQIPAELLTLAAKLTDANAAIFDAANNYAGCIPGIHEVLRRQGLLEDILCIDPKITLSPGQLEEIDRVYADYPELNDDDFVKSNLSKWRNM